MNTTKTLSTVQRLNRLPVGTVINFGIGYANGTHKDVYLEKVEAEGRFTTYGKGVEPFWKDMDSEHTYYPKTKIPGNFVIVEKEYIEIKKLENNRAHLSYWVYNDLVEGETLEKVKKSIEYIEKQIEELRAELNGDQEIEIA